MNVEQTAFKAHRREPGWRAEQMRAGSATTGNASTAAA